MLLFFKLPVTLQNPSEGTRDEAQNGVKKRQVGVWEAWVVGGWGWWLDMKEGGGAAEGFGVDAALLTLFVKIIKPTFFQFRIPFFVCFLEELNLVRVQFVFSTSKSAGRLLLWSSVEMFVPVRSWNSQKHILTLNEPIFCPPRPHGALWEVRCYFCRVGSFCFLSHAKEFFFSSSAVFKKDGRKQHLICISSSLGMITELQVFCDLNRRVPHASPSFPRWPAAWFCLDVTDLRTMSLTPDEAVRVGEGLVQPFKPFIASE